MAHGATKGERRIKPRYVKGSGLVWRYTTEIEPENADKLLDLCDAANLSAAQIMNRLIEAVPRDPKTGLPIPPGRGPIQEALPVAT